ncbi:MAG: hypothetical protein ABSH25_04405, partial [Syntrophorhabdales bacterium]
SHPSSDEDEVIALDSPKKGRLSRSARIVLASHTLKKGARGSGARLRKAHALHHRHRKSA